MSKSKHFAGLDGLRFISITFVVLHHLFTFKSNFGFSRFDYPVLGVIGYYGIQFFFMGSGFLITYLLLHEHTSTGAISMRHFFIRRIIRIWPGYYLLILLALALLLHVPFFRIPGITDSYLHANYLKSNLFYFFFLPHLQPFFFPTGPYVHHTYTIGIEEQFYILWGVLFFFFIRRMHPFLIALFVVCLSLNLLKEYLHAAYPAPVPTTLSYIKSTITYIQYSRISTFTIGSIFGYAYFQQRRWIFLFKKAWVQVLVYVVLVAIIGFRLEVPFVYNEYISTIMGCVMLMATFKNESLINYSAPWISYLGKISYGIYLFHIFAIVLACKAVRVFVPVETNLFVTLLLCLLTLAFSILFGAVSYHYFERYFLRLKKHFRHS